MQVKCPACAGQFAIPLSQPEQVFGCPKCGQLLKEPAQEGPPPAPPAPPRLGLKPCKICGEQIAALAKSCPKCGIDRPGQRTGAIAVLRATSLTGIMYPISIAINGRPAGELPNGGQLSIELPAGSHRLEASGGMMTRSIEVQVVDGREERFQVYFSAWGVLGGGLILKQV